MISGKTSDPNGAAVQLQVDAKVSQDLALDQDRVVFAVAQGKASPVTVTVSSLGKKPFKLERAEDPTGAVTAALTPNGATWQVVLTLASDTAKNNGVVKVTTDRADQAVLEVPYAIAIRGPAQPLRDQH